VTSVASAAGIKTTYEYDARGLTTKITDALGNSTTYGYDDAGRTTSTTDEDVPIVVEIGR
jgi:YD repeat-containing protein